MPGNSLKHTLAMNNDINPERHRAHQTVVAAEEQAVEQAPSKSKKKSVKED